MIVYIYTIIVYRPNNLDLHRNKFKKSQINAFGTSYLSIFIFVYFFHNKPYSTAVDKNSGTERRMLTALTAALQNWKIK